METQTNEKKSAAKKIEILPKCLKSHALTSKDGHWECGEEECKENKEYYPVDQINYLKHHDFVR